MARNIALGIKVKIDGNKETIRTISELEDAIKLLNEELRDTEAGTKKFDRIVGDISKLKAGLRDVNREIEGVDKQQQFELFASSVNGVTGAFLVATSAAQAFGAEGKSLEEIQKFQAKALALVNVALGVRQVLEAGVKFQLLQRTLVEKAAVAGTFLLTKAQAAYTAVVAGTTGALKALRIAIASTGIGLLIVGVGALIAKLTEAKDETEDLAEETKKLSEYQSESAQSAGAEIYKIQQLTKVIKQADVPLQDRVEAYKELTKLVPELSGYTLQQAQDEGILNKAIEDQIKLIGLRARARALEDYLVEEEKRRIADEEKRKEAERFNTELSRSLELQQEYNRALAGGDPIAMRSREEFEEYYATLKGWNLEANDRNAYEEELLDVQTQVSELTGDINRRIGERAKVTKDANEAQKKANDLYNEQIKLLQNAAKALGGYTLEGEVSVKVLEEANEILEKQNELLDKRKENLETDSQKSVSFMLELKDLIGGLIVPDELPVQINDAFANVFSNVEQYANGVEQNVYKVQQQLYSEIYQAGEDLLRQQNDLTDAQVAALTNEEKIAAFRKQVGEDSLAILLDYYQTNVDIVEGFEAYNEQVELTNQRVRDLNKFLSDENKIRERNKISYVEFQDLINNINTVEVQRLDNLKSESQIQEEIRGLVAEQLFGTQDLTQLTEVELELLESTTKTLREQSKLYQGVRDVATELAELTTKITENAKKQQRDLADTSGLEAFIKANADKIDEIDSFFEFLTEENSNLTEDQIKNIQKLIDEIKTDALIDKIAEVSQKIVQLFTDISSRIATVISAQNSLLLEQLEYSQQLTLQTIGDSTEEAVKEREKVEKEYAKKRFNVEKQSRITELQFSLADAIAQGANSIIQTYATVGFPFGIPLAAIMAGIVAAQVATINNQIGFTRSKQFIGRRGGLIDGASHEQGGVNFGNYNLEGGEAIISRSAVSQYADMLSQMNMSVGARPLAMDDSRIVEEIRRQNQKPIKTYVLDQDIQDTRKINARLEEISRL